MALVVDVNHPPPAPMLHDARTHSAELSPFELAPSVALELVAVWFSAFVLMRVGVYLSQYLFGVRRVLLC